MVWIKRHPMIVNPLLAFLVALLAGAWTNLYTSSTTDSPMLERYHLLLVLAVVFLAVQCWYNIHFTRVEKKIIHELLDLGIRFFTVNAKPGTKITDLRVMVHLYERHRPGPSKRRQGCLVPRYCKSPVPPRDFGPIPLEEKEYVDWYVNAKAYSEQSVVCEEPMSNERPSGNGFYIDNPSQFKGKSVISAPIWCLRQPDPYILGTLTFDSTLPLADLNWKSNGQIYEPAKDLLDSLADLIGKVLSDEESAI